MLNRLLRRLGYFWHRRQMDADLADELQFHQQMVQLELERSGMSPDVAGSASRKALGNMTLAREDVRRMWVWWWLDDLSRDLAHATRRLRASPGYCAIAILILSIVIGANSAVFGAVYAVLLRPFVIHQPDDLRVIWGSDPRRSLPVLELSYRNFEDWAAHSRSFTHLTAVGSSNWPTVLDDADESTRLSRAGVASSFFSTMGVLPFHGRPFSDEDNSPKAAPVVIISHGLWARRFGTDPQAIGRLIKLDERDHAIVGVMPEGFDFPRGTDLWTPVVPILTKDWGMEALEQVGALFVIGRLWGGVTSNMAADELQRLLDSVQSSSASPRVVVTSFLDFVLGPARQGLWALLAAVGVLMIVGCSNLSCLLLTRVSSRRREHAIHAALGATRTALARRWMIETLLLSLAGGAIGLLAAYGLARPIINVAPDVPRLADLAINLPVLIFTSGIIMTTSLLFALAPILAVKPASLLASLHESARATSGPKVTGTQSLLVTAQIALSVVLLIAAGLIVRSFDNLLSIDPGFLPSNVMTMTIEPRSDGGSTNAWMDGLIERVSSVPGVEAVGAIYLRPLALGTIGQETWVLLEGQQDTPEVAQHNPQLNYQIASPGYFRAMHIQLLEGRLFTDEDTDWSPRVALVSETTARRLWPGGDPIGKRLLLPTFTQAQPGGEWRTVVGVVSDVRYRGLNDLRLDVYDPLAQATLAAKDLVVRTAGDPLNVLDAVRTEARRLDPRVVVDRVTTMDTVLSQALAPWRLCTWLLATVAGIAFGLVTVGLFSTVSLDSRQRRRDVAVRLALGAQRADIVGAILYVALGRAVLGIAFGTLSALALTRGLESLLVGLTPLDLTTHGAVIALALTTVGLASWLPSYRATTVEPIAALRCE